MYTTKSYGPLKMCDFLKKALILKCNYLWTIFNITSFRYALKICRYWSDCFFFFLLIIFSWTIGFCVGYTTRRAQSRNRTAKPFPSWTGNRRSIPNQRTRSRRSRLRRRRVSPEDSRPRRTPATFITLTRRSRCRGFTLTRAARSTWFRQSSRARSRASRSGRNGKRPSTFLIITWMPSM